MKVLVTGGTGFLGSRLVRRLLKEGFQVRVLHRKTSSLELLQGLNFETALGDVTDYLSIREACSQVDAVFHAAAIIAYNSSENEKMKYVNVGGTENVLKAVAENKVSRLVHTSSVVAVGTSLKKVNLDESSTFNMKSFGYYETKWHAEELVKSYVSSGRVDAVIVNPSIMFGEGDATKSSRKIHMKVARGLIPFYPPGGVNVADVEDVLDGHVQAFHKGRSGERYILGGENISIRTLFQWLAESGGHKGPWIPVPGIILRAAKSFSESMYLSTLYHWYDISKAQKELGYKPRSAREAVTRSVQWAKLNGYL